MYSSLLALCVISLYAVLAFADTPPLVILNAGGFLFQNTDGDRLPKGAQIPSGLSGHFRYYRKTNGEARIGYFGGLQEAIVYKNVATNQTFENLYFNRILEWVPSLKGYVEILPTTSLRPSPRSYTCGGFDSRTNRLYIYGGTNAPALGESLTPANIFNDLWAFDFTLSRWFNLTSTGTSPGDRASTGCASNGNSIFLFSGATFTGLFTVGDFNPNDLYRLDLPASTAGVPNWVQVRAPGNTQLPPGRTQPSADLLPGTTKIFVRGGDRFILPDFTRQTQNDIFTYNFQTNVVTILDNSTAPQPPFTQEAVAAVHPDIILFQNGDQQGNQTLNTTCSNPKFLCTFPNSQVEKTFVYNLNRQKFRQVFPETDLPSTRRSALGAYVQFPNGNTELIDTFFKNIDSYGNILVTINVVFNGGYGFNGGPTGLGEIRNPYTFLWKIPYLAF